MFIESLKCFSDIRGNLHPICLSELPFSPKRLFLVSDVPKGEERGGHAHYITEQYLICLKGEIEVLLYDGEEKVSKVLKPMQGIYIPNLVWDSQVFRTEDDLLLVLASTDYDREDYIESISVFNAVKK
jgi:UDP-2-acetamido-3-amino-2,3-dideoxy-glucuronate N-acetyltransferase